MRHILLRPRPCTESDNLNKDLVPARTGPRRYRAAPTIRWRHAITLDDGTGKPSDVWAISQPTSQSLVVLCRNAAVLGSSA